MSEPQTPGAVRAAQLERIAKIYDAIDLQKLAIHHRSLLLNAFAETRHEHRLFVASEVGAYLPTMRERLERLARDEEWSLAAERLGEIARLIVALEHESRRALRAGEKTS